MKSYKLRSIYVLCIVLLISSCEKGTDITCKITNNSSEQVTVKAHSSYFTPNQTVETVLEANETKEVFTHSQPIGGFHETTSITNVIDSITALTPSGKVLIKHYNQNSDWSKEIDKKKQTITFTAVVNDITLK